MTCLELFIFSRSDLNVLESRDVLELSNHSVVNSKDAHVGASFARMNCYIRAWLISELLIVFALMLVNLFSKRVTLEIVKVE